MTPELVEAATDLADMLDRENAALAALDLAAAAALAESKRRVTDSFLAARARAPAGPLGQEAERIATRLRDLAAENKRLLERAMFVQGRVLATIARAIPRVQGGAQHYRANGALVTASKAAPVAFCARA